jgi:hypothetical protein
LLWEPGIRGMSRVVPWWIRVRHFHLTLPCFVIFRGKLRKSVWSLGNHAGKLKMKLGQASCRGSRTSNWSFHAALQPRTDPSLVCSRSTEPQAGVSDCLLSIIHDSVPFLPNEFLTETWNKPFSASFVTLKPRLGLIIENTASHLQANRLYR